MCDQLSTCDDEMWHNGFDIGTFLSIWVSAKFCIVSSCSQTKSFTLHEYRSYLLDSKKNVVKHKYFYLKLKGEFHPRPELKQWEEVTNFFNASLFSFFSTTIFSFFKNKKVYYCQFKKVFFQFGRKYIG